MSRKDIMKALKGSGVQVVIANNSHPYAIGPDGQRMKFAGSPGKQRSTTKFKSAVRRHFDIELDPTRAQQKAAKERRAMKNKEKIMSNNNEERLTYKRSRKVYDVVLERKSLYEFSLDFDSTLTQEALEDSKGLLTHWLEQGRLIEQQPEVSYEVVITESHSTKGDYSGHFNITKN